MGRANIKDDGVKFSSENQPANRGRKKGSKNRSTILKKWLEAKTEITNPISKEKQKGTVEDEVILALISKARKGDVQAIKEIQDSMYGKIPNKDEITGKDGEDLFRNITVQIVDGTDNPNK